VPVEVRPDSFSMVFFDAGEIRALVEQLITEVGLPAGTSVTIDVDETTPLGRAQIASLDPIVISAESGALEDPKAPRQLDPIGTADVLGKLLLQARDRLDPAFGDVPADRDLSLQETSAWEAYSVGRLGRLGHRVQRQRRLYQFRNRHGFTDAADAAFDALWSGTDLTWAQITALSTEAKAAQPA
jgi:hypothetical protein